ncbi:hypothetical protein ACFOG5_24630 [Pedobacter fastidiosus]
MKNKPENYLILVYLTFTTMEMKEWRGIVMPKKIWKRMEQLHH